MNIGQFGRRVTGKVYRTLSGPSPKTASAAFQQSLDLAKNQKFHASLKVAKKAQARWPNDNRLLRPEARALLKLGKAGQAMDVLRKIEARDPDLDKIKVLRRAIYLACIQQSPPQEALRIAQQALEIWASDTEFTNYAARANKRLEQRTRQQEQVERQRQKQTDYLAGTYGALRNRTYRIKAIFRPAKKVAVFGTCRVFKPMIELTHNRDVALSNGQFTNYTQSMPETLQQLRIMQGQYTVPTDLEEFFFDRKLRTDQNRKFPDLSALDNVLCEISTARSFCYKGVYFQVNYLMRHLIEKHGDLLKPWFTAASARNAERRQAALCAVLKTDHNLTPLEIDILENLQVNFQTAQDLRHDICTLRDSFDVPITLVTHCDVTTSQGGRIASRVALIEDVARIARTEGLDVYQPATLIDSYGQHAAMDADGADANHYAPAFHKIVARHLYRRYLF